MCTGDLTTFKLVIGVITRILVVLTGAIVASLLLKYINMYFKLENGCDIPKHLGQS